MAFHIHIEPHQAEEYIERVLEVQLQIAHHLIVAIGKECFQTAHEALGITFAHIFYKLGNREPAFVLCLRRVKRKQIFNKALFHLTIRKPQHV